MANLSTQAKFVLGAAATGAYLGDITEDPVGGLMGSVVLAGTATFMKLSTSNIKEAGMLPASFVLDSDKISKGKNQGYTDREAETLAKLNNYFSSREKKLRNVEKYKKSIEKNNAKVLDPNSKLSGKAKRRLEKRNKVMSNFIKNNSIEVLDKQAGELSEKLKTFGRHIQPTFEGLQNYGRSITDPKEASRLLSLAGGATPFSGIDVEDSVRTSKASVFKLNTTKTDSLDKLSTYLQKQFNNNPEVALEKAKLILERNAGEQITVKGGTVLYTDKFTGKSNSIPITSVTPEGVFYHSPKPGTNFAVSASNPYGPAFANKTPVRILGTNETRVPTFEDVTKRIHPELLALQVSQGKDITDPLEIARAQLRHGLDESVIELDLPAKVTDENISQRFRAAGSSTNYGNSLNYDINGRMNEDRPLRRMATVSKAGGTSSEAKAVLTEIMQGYLEHNPDMADNILNNISLNDTTTLSGVDFQSIAPMSMNQRGATAVGVRDMVAVKRTEAADLLSGVYSGFESQFESSNVFSKLDIQNKATYNNLLNQLFGGETSRVLADGSGFFNNSEQVAENLSAHVSNRLMIGRQQNGSILLQDERLVDLLDTYKRSGLTTGIDDKFIQNYQRGQAAKEYITNYKAANPTTSRYADITDASTSNDYMAKYGTSRGADRLGMNNNIQPFMLESGKTLGIDASGNKIGIHKQYSSAELTGLLIDEEGNLLIHSNAKFNPGEERVAKIFSEASKANLYGMDEKLYTKVSTMGVLLNEGILNPLTDSKAAMMKKITQAYVGVQEAVKNNQELSPLQQRIHQAITSDFILAGEDTNTQGISKVMGQTSVGNIDTVLKDRSNKLEFTEKARANLNRLAKMRQGATSDLTAKKFATLATMMQGNFKSATDLNLTVANDVFSNFDAVSSGRGTEGQQTAIKTMLGGLLVDEKNTIDSLLQDSQVTRQKLANLLQESTSATNLSGPASETYQDNLYKFTHGLTQNNLDAYAAGMMKSVGAVNKGQAVLGVGNTARMSWTAYDQLLKSGFTQDDLKAFGKTDFKTMLDLEGIFGERSGHTSAVEKFAINGKIGTNSSNIERILRDTTPESRVASLRTLGVDVAEKSPFITYRLQNSYKDLEYLNFNTMTTSHSGSHDDGLKIMMKDLEKSRVELFSLDQQLSETTGDAREQVKIAFEKSAEKYQKLANNLLTGPNSLVKKAASLVSSQSNISLAMAVGGEAYDYIEKQVGTKNGVFISQEGLALRLERMGITNVDDVEVKLIDGYKNLHTVKYKVGGEWINLKSLITREPAQGPLATTYEDLILDNSIEKTGTGAHLGVTENHTGFSKGKYLDYDQDTLQELFGKLSSKSEQVVLDTKFARISKSLEDLLPLADKIKVKGSKNTINTPGDFESAEDLVSFKNTAGVQGRERKSLAGVATRLATNLSAALGMEFNDVNPDRATRGRFLGHVLVENLLKSAHLGTKDFAKQAESDIESLGRLRGDYVDGRLNAKDYRTAIEPIYRRSLNLDNPEIKGESKVKLDSVLGDMLTAEVNQAKLVSSEARSPLDVPTSKIGGSIIDRAKQALSRFTSMTYELDLQGTRSYGRMAREIKVNIASTLKNNKGILGIGAAALALGSIMTRDGAEVSEERERMVRGNGGKMITGPQNVPMGINTNTTASSYVTPKVQNTGQKSVEVQGDFSEYADYGNATTYSDQTASLSSAIFGDNLRTARLE